jgi:Cys-tRNA(Pro)/Cys-tRNA(Cys) deacylase
MIKNNVTRMLEARGVPYTCFELPAEKLSAQEVARYLGVEAGQVFKTIVVLREGAAKPVLAVIPGPLQVDLRALAKAVNEKKLVLATQRQAEQVTGLLTGGISPLALLNRGFEVVLDELAQLYDEVYISGGQRGLNIRLPISNLIEITGARLAAITT